MNRVYIIGCGGGGSWLAPSMCLLVGAENVTLIDGDILEPGNLNRQLFTEDDLGSNKAEALARRYRCQHVAGWYNRGCIRHHPGDWLMACVDNNRARLSVIEACDDYGCQSIFAANETTSAEAYYYNPDDIDTVRDPRKMYPEILTDTTNDPQARAAGCTGLAQVQNRQLVSANFMSAALAQHLFVLWALEHPNMTEENPDIVMDFFPHKLVANLSRLETYTIEGRIL